MWPHIESNNLRVIWWIFRFGGLQGVQHISIVGIDFFLLWGAPMKMPFVPSCKRLHFHQLPPKFSCVEFHVPGGRRAFGGGGWHDTLVCFGLQLVAPIGQSPFTAALPLDPFPPQAAAPIGLSPPCVLPLPPYPISTSPLPFPFPWLVVPPDFPCFTALCWVCAEEGNCPCRWPAGASQWTLPKPRWGTSPQRRLLGPGCLLAGSLPRRWHITTFRLSIPALSPLCGKRIMYPLPPPCVRGVCVVSPVPPVAWVPFAVVGGGV